MINRRHFTITAATLAGLPFAGFTGALHAQAAAPKAGKDYLVLGKPVATEAPAGKVEVIEFFSYNCPHCAEFEPTLEAWQKKLPQNVAFAHVPVPFVGSDVEAKQRFYYTLAAMGKVDAMQAKIFKAIHEERQNLVGDQAILAWVAKQPDLDAKKFESLFNSFTVVTKAKRASQLTDAYKVSGVPAFGVAGRFYVDGETAGGMPQTLKVVDALVAQAHKG